MKRSDSSFFIRSIRRYLTRTILLVLVCSSTVGLVVSYALFHHEVSRVYDNELRLINNIVSGMVDSQTEQSQLEKVARELAVSPQAISQRISPLDDRSAELPQPDTSIFKRSSRHSSSIIALGFWRGNGTPLMVSHGWLAQSQSMNKPNEGFSQVNHDGESWRVYSRYDHDSKLWVAVGIRQTFQDSLSRDTVLINWATDAIAVIVAGLLILSIIRRATRPLDDLSRQLSQRHEQDLSPIESPAPAELEGLKRSLNAFIERLHESLERERRFTGDAAHELRTPLAALKIHLDNIRLDQPEQAQESLTKVHLGIERLQRVIAQLLTLARVDQLSASELKDINLYSVAAHMAGEMLPLAEDRGHQLSVTGLDRLYIHANATEVSVLLRNLIDNALRYTPAGGVITVHLDQDPLGHPVIDIIDNGKGIPPALINKVTERFKRGASPLSSGSGLGLSIVKAVLHRQNATLELMNREEGGLIARVTWLSPATLMDTSATESSDGTSSTD